MCHSIAKFIVRASVVHDLSGSLAHDLSADALLRSVDLEQRIVLPIALIRHILLVSHRAILLD